MGIVELKPDYPEQLARAIQNANNAYLAQRIPVGTILMWPGTTAPAGTLILQGQLVNRADWPDLWQFAQNSGNIVDDALWSNRKGSFTTGNGSTTFRLPDLRGRVPVGCDSTQAEFTVLGRIGGEKAVTLQESQVPAKTWQLNASTGDAPYCGVLRTFGNQNITVTQTAQYVYDSVQSRTSPNMASRVSWSYGGGESHNNLQPYATVNFIIIAKAETTHGDIESALAELISQTQTARDSANQAANDARQMMDDIENMVTEGVAEAKGYTDAVAAGKVDKVAGKGLSTNDYTNTDKSKVDNLPANTNAELDSKADLYYVSTNLAALDTLKADKSALSETNLRIATLEEKTIKRYGVRRAIGSSSPALERVGDAVGLTAAVGVGDTPATNDFDNIYPWSHMRRCNLDDNGNVTAYEGEPSYSTNGSNGQVMVEIPRFYQKHEIVDGYEYWWVCEMPLGGYRLSPAFIGSSGQVLDKIYIGAYDAGYDGTSKATSVAGVHPEVRRSRTSFRTIAKARGTGWQLLDIAMMCDVVQFLFIVEFATTHCQSIINGVTNLSYTATHAAAFTELAANRIVIPNAQAAAYVVGQSIEIGTSQGGGQIAKGRVITEITPLADGINTALVFDGEAVDVTQGNLVYSSGWVSGGADGVVASSGSATSDSSGKSPFKWRGIENAWGNVFQWIDGVNITDNQAWVSLTPAEYDDTSVAAPYKKLNFKNGNENGYVKTLGEDINYPWARFPTETGASATTYYSDYYYQISGLRACCLGGSLHNGTSAGLFFFYCNAAASYSNVAFGARIAYKP